jgi:hypothetical protein
MVMLCIPLGGSHAADGVADKAMGNAVEVESEGVGCGHALPSLSLPLRSSESIIRLWSPGPFFLIKT